jgi:5'-methylthioadenosine phosphorylase
LLAIIGGSGLSQLGTLEVTRRQVVRTPYGEPSGALTFGRIAHCEVVFLARHGYGHTIAPHEVNYRANVWALKDVGVTEVVSVASVGGIRNDTWGRPSTFYEGAGVAVNHIDFTEPYTRRLREQLLAAAVRCGETLVDGGVYAATQGPRLESAAEINRLERDGADVVGMTGMPEAALAREIGLEYAAIAVVANYAAGRGDSARAIPLDKIGSVLDEAMGRVRRIIGGFCEAKK